MVRRLASTTRIVGEINFQLPTKKLQRIRRRSRLTVIPPPRWCPTDTLAVLCVPQQVGQTEEGIGSWMIAADEHLNAFILSVTGVAKGVGHKAHRISFRSVTDGDREVRMFESQRLSVGER